MPYPILEFDPDPAPLIDPQRLIKPIDIAPKAVLCFFREVLDDHVQSGRLRQMHLLGTEWGPNPVYELDHAGQRLAVMHPGVGAPIAAGFTEELIALGVRGFIACGGAGSLHPEITLGHLVVPTAAVRDEGTSYHYLPPSREVAAPAAGVAAVERALQAQGLPYVAGKTWTTDAFYRETPGRIATRRAEGCLTVEMEAAAFFAVAQHRHIPFGQILYGADDLSGTEWDSRGWNDPSHRRHNLFELAVAAAAGMQA